MTSFYLIEMYESNWFILIRTDVHLKRLWLQHVKQASLESYQSYFRVRLMLIPNVILSFHVFH